MQFSAECWVRTYRLESDWLGAFGWQVRAVFYALLVKFDAAGLIPLGFASPETALRLLSGLTAIPIDVLEPALQTLLDAQVLRYEDTPQGLALLDPRFLERGSGGAKPKARRPGAPRLTAEGEAVADDGTGSELEARPPMTAAERQRAYRERRRQATGGPPALSSGNSISSPNGHNFNNSSGQDSVTERNGVTLRSVTESVTRYVTRNGERYGDRDEETQAVSSSYDPRYADRYARYALKERKKEDLRSPLSPRGGEATERDGEAREELTETNTAPFSSGETSRFDALEARATEQAPRNGSADPNLRASFQPDAKEIKGPAADRPAPAESGTFVAAHRAAVAGRSETDGDTGSIEILPPLPDPLAAQQLPCGKPVRDTSTRNFEFPFLKKAYCDAVAAATGHPYAFPFERSHRAALDEAVDAHAPRGDVRKRVDWISHAVRFFAVTVDDEAKRYRHGYDSRGFLAWCNAGELQKVIQEQKASVHYSHVHSDEPPPNVVTDDGHVRMKEAIAKERAARSQARSGRKTKESVEWMTARLGMLETFLDQIETSPEMQGTFGSPDELRHEIAELRTYLDEVQKDFRYG